MQQRKRHRLGVVGLGLRLGVFLRNAHAEGWDFEIASVVDPAPVGASLLAQRGIDAGKAVSSIHELQGAGPIDLVMIGSPNHLHLQHLTEALDLGTRIFIEKPIVRTPEESIALAALLAGREVPPIYVGLVARSAPVVREAFALLESGAIGQVISIDATEHLPPAHGAYLATNWRRRQEWGGSFLLDKVCHDFDILRRIAGARPAAVASFGGRRIFIPDRPAAAAGDGPVLLQTHAGWSAAADASGADMDVTDHQVAIIDYENGVRLSFHSNSSSAVPERRWQVIGTEGVLNIDLVGHGLTLTPLPRTRPVEQRRWRGPPGDSHGGADQAMAHDLVAALEDRTPFPVTVMESLVAGLTVMAIDQAMASRSVVDCGPIWRELDTAAAGGRHS
jgi:predicted dehydrogenase